jgi:PAS domain S-box-containing protein
MRESTLFRSAGGPTAFLGGAMEQQWSVRDRGDGLGEWLRPIFGLPIVGAVLWDASGRIVDANDRFLEITGYGRSDLEGPGLDWRRLTPREWHSLDEEAISQLRSCGKTFAVEKEYLRKDGDRVSVQLSSLAVRGSDSLFLSLVVDVTGQARAQAERDALLERERVARERAEEAVRSREEILAVVSHDLRNPLNTISICVSLLANPMGKERHDAQLDVVRRAVGRMTHLINDLLDVNQIASGRFTVTPVLVDVGSLVEEARAALDLQASQQGRALEWRCDDPTLRVRADPARIVQVLVNLVGNALKFTPAGGHVSVKVGRDGDSACFSVADTGPGIDPEHLPHIFGRFWQAEGRERRGGVGLGLAISRGIVAAHGGRIEARSEPGRGSTFRFTIPLAPPDPD